MNQPKRHHWWPMAQSRYWTDSQGRLTVTRSDGTSFLASPLNIGVESELYTRFLEDDTKDTSIEDWFATTIDRPAKTMIEHLLDRANVTRRPFSPTPRKAAALEAVGFRVRRYVDVIRIPASVRKAIAEYVAALLVRHPAYLARLTAFHADSGLPSTGVRTLALENMLYLFPVYAERIAASVFVLTRRVGSTEYVYSDGGLVVKEPWDMGGAMPFDIHAPLTPDVALQVFPLPPQSPDALDLAAIGEATNLMVGRQNRIVMGSARRFLFSRQAIAPAFVQRHFGKPAPANIGYRWVDGHLKTWFDPTRS